MHVAFGRVRPMEQSEVISVRMDERFDEKAVGQYLNRHLEGALGTMAVRQFSGGHANLTYLLTFTDGETSKEFVLRRPPLGPVVPGAHDMAREHHVLSRLWKGFQLAPRSYLLCEDPSVLGAPFFVMERRSGVVVRRNVPEIFGGGADLGANRALSEVVIDTLADFHAVDPAAADLADLGRPDGFLQRQVAGWTRRWHGSKVEDSPLVDELIGWLEANLPASPPPSLVHNDWRLDNMAVAEDDPGRCVAVFDWDMCTQGDPLADLGTLLSVWYDEAEVPSTLNPMPTGAPGFLDRDEAIERYAARTGTDSASIDYYVVFGSFKMAVVIQQIYIRWQRGQTEDERFAEMGEGAQRLFALAADRRP